MKVPRAGQAVVERHKLVQYLLEPTHPDNGGKAAFFQTLGYTQANWQNLSDALRHIAAVSDITEKAPSPYGEKYIIDAELPYLAGGVARVRTIWIVESDHDAPRLVTAYPAPSGNT